MVRVSYHAQEQMKRLSPKERAELDRVLNNRDQPPKKVEASGRFVSRFGNNKRVVWQKTDGDDVVILTVVSK